MAYDPSLVAALLDAVRPLLDHDNVTPFISAWEIDPHNLEVDGEEMWERLRQAAVALDPTITAEPFEYS